MAFLLGNGFTMDFVSQIRRAKPELASRINVGNIFSDGGVLRWPLDERPGFLSYKNSPHLWSIGARSYLRPEETIQLLERVVTCANVYSSRKGSVMSEKAGNGFLHAYRELVYYLKYLFIHYDSLVGPVTDYVRDWAWLSFIRQLNDDPEVEQVVVVTYNYDVWLERALMESGIQFGVPILSVNPGAKFQIFKPHGSISYTHAKSLPRESFSINYNSMFNDCPITEINVAYENLGGHTPVNFLIPPAGEAGRSAITWAQAIRDEASKQLSEFGSGDLAIVCGLSYWHVDRAEIDLLLNSMHSAMNVVHLNPAPSPTLDAVLNSLFVNYTHLASSDLLIGYPA
ncbi:hypothetical protein G3I15_30100 [Streptomyces sp. SID10244]|nr:hypothetical protein [Streptomyces sp. SID10244]